MYNKGRQKLFNQYLEPDGKISNAIDTSVLLMNNRNINLSVQGDWFKLSFIRGYVHCPNSIRLENIKVILVGDELEISMIWQ